MAEATKTYTVVTRVKHDGNVYAKGEQVKLTQAQAGPLLAGGSITADKAVAKSAADNGSNAGGQTQE